MEPNEETDEECIVICRQCEKTLTDREEAVIERRSGLCEECFDAIMKNMECWSALNHMKKCIDCQELYSDFYYRIANDENVQFVADCEGDKDDPITKYRKIIEVCKMKQYRENEAGVFARDILALCDEYDK